MLVQLPGEESQPVSSISAMRLQCGIRNHPYPITTSCITIVMTLTTNTLQQRNRQTSWKDLEQLQDGHAMLCLSTKYHLLVVPRSVTTEVNFQIQGSSGWPKVKPHHGGILLMVYHYNKARYPPRMAREDRAKLGCFRYLANPVAWMLQSK